MRLYNWFVRWLLRSRWHGWMSKDNLLITLTGKKSGTTLTVPVNYLREGDLIYIVSFRKRTWWRNLRGGAAVTLRLQGRDVPAHAQAHTEQSAVEQGIAECIRLLPVYARLLGVTRDPRSELNRDQLARAAQTRVIVRARLT